MIRIISKVVVLLTFLISQKAQSQQFRYQAEVKPVLQSGFYALTITPEIMALCRADLNDIRIADEQGKWVPHLLRSALPSFVQQRYTMLPPVGSSIIDSGRVHWVVENKNRMPVSQLNILMANHGVSRSALLSGSDDGLHWYIIGDHYMLVRTYETRDDYFAAALDIPVSRYRYFRISVQRAGTDPVQIREVGVVQPDSVMIHQDAWMPLPAPVVKQENRSNKRTYVRLQFEQSYSLERLNLFLSGVPFFERTMRLYKPVGGMGMGQLLASFTVSSRIQPVLVGFQQVKTRELLIEIENDDNPPLVVDSVRADFLPRRLIGYLEAGKNYRIKLGDSMAVKPAYDLDRFADSIPDQLLPMQTDSLRAIPGAAPLPARHVNYWVWLVIACSVLFLGWIAWRMIGDQQHLNSD